MAFKLTPQERRAVYDLWVKEGKSNKVAIGKKYNISARTVGRIIADCELIDSKRPQKIKKIVEGVHCYNCQTSISWDALGENDGLCPQCGLEYELDDVEEEQRDDYYASKQSQLSAQAVHKPVDKKVSNVVCTTGQIMVTFSDGSTSSVSRTNARFLECFDMVRDNKLEELVELIDIATMIKKFTFGSDIEVVGGLLFYNGEAFDNRLAKRIVEECEAGSLGVNKYIAFLRKLMKNPSYHSVESVYEFIEHTDLEILDDGNIKAYKRLKIENDVPVDIHTGKVENWKGWTIQMPRYMVEDNPNKTCSQGLHVAAQHYFQFFTHNQSTDVEVSVSPEHVVSVPTDYASAKCRVCEYTLLTGVEHPEGKIATVVIGKEGKKLA